MMVTTIAAMVELLVDCVVRHGNTMMLVVLRISSMVMRGLVVLMSRTLSGCVHHGHHSLLLLLVVHHIPIVTIQIETLSLMTACSM